MDILPLEKFIAELEFSYLLILPSKKKKAPPNFNIILSRD